MRRMILVMVAVLAVMFSFSTIHAQAGPKNVKVGFAAFIGATGAPATGAEITLSTSAGIQTETVRHSNVTFTIPSDVTGGTVTGSLPGFCADPLDPTFV